MLCESEMGRRRRVGSKKWVVRKESGVEKWGGWRERRAV